MDLNKLYELKEKLIKLSKLTKKTKHNHYYLTVEEKKELLRNGKRIPLRVKVDTRKHKKRNMGL